MPIHRSCLGGEHTTVPRITIQVRRTVVRARTRQITHTRSQSRKEVDSLALTLRSTISYTETGPRDCTSTQYNTHRRHQNGDTNTIVRLPPANRNTWRTRPCEGAPPGWGRFFKSSHQGSILAWLNARTGHTSKAI